MAHIFADNVREVSLTEGTGAFTTQGGIPAPGGVMVGRPLSDVLDIGDTFDYTITHTSLNQWEIGVGTYQGASQFSRSPTSSSNNGSLVNFSAGSKHVFITPVAARMEDDVLDSRLPSTQSGKTFTSTVTITGQSGLRINYADQEISLGGIPADIDDFAVVHKIRNTFSTWYVDADKLPDGYNFRVHESGSNERDVFNINPDGTAELDGLPVTTVSDATSESATVFPVGHTVLVVRDSAIARNAVITVRLSTENTEEYVTTGAGDELEGTWRCRGGSSVGYHLAERVE